MSNKASTSRTLAIEIAKEYAIGEPATKRVDAILAILQRSQIVTSDFCNWCGHAKRKHVVSVRGVGQGAGCLAHLSGTGNDVIYCQCTASRGVVRMPRKAK